MKTKTHLYEKFGHTFYNVTGVDIDYTLKGMKLRLDNLFGGVKGLGNLKFYYIFIKIIIKQICDYFRGHNKSILK